MTERAAIVPHIVLDIVVEACAVTDVGRVRQRNEDSVRCGDLEGAEWTYRAAAPIGRRGLAVVVCDGMGGVQGGEVASKIAAEQTLAQLQVSEGSDDLQVVARVLRRAVRTANLEVWQLARKRSNLRGMGTTLSAVMVVGQSMVVAQIGDSRVYILRRAVLTQVTRDQSLLSAMIANNLLGPDEQPSDHAAAAILQALGVDSDVEPSLSIVELRTGDRILVCSDGLHGFVGEYAVTVLLGSIVGATPAATRLVEAARMAGGGDNITVAVIDVLSGPPEPVDNDDQPEFVEFDPQEEGLDALSKTSTVARRLASRIGIGSDPGKLVPTTGQHTAIPKMLPATQHPVATAAVDIDGPATRQVVQPIPWGWWMLAAAAVLLMIWLVVS